MKTYIKQFMDKYYVVASIDYTHDGHELRAPGFSRGVTD